MKKENKILMFDIMMFYPLIANFIIFVWILIDYNNIPYHNNWKAAILLILGLSLILCGICGTVYSIFKVVKNKKLRKSAKVFWTFIIIILNYFIVPVFYLKHIRYEFKEVGDRCSKLT